LNSSAARANSRCCKACWPARKDRSICSSDVWQVADRGEIDQTVRRIETTAFNQISLREPGSQVQHRQTGGRPALTYRVRMLESYPQSELNYTGQVVLAGNLPETGAAATTGIGWIKLRMVESVEKLCPELGTDPFTWTKLSIFEHGKVKILAPVVPYIRFPYVNHCRSCKRSGRRR